jgi:hypothetical protein
MRERIIKDAAIPAKYNLLMAVIAYVISAHPDGVRALSDDASAAAAEDEITRGGRGWVLIRRRAAGRNGC